MTSVIVRCCLVLLLMALPVSAELEIVLEPTDVQVTSTTDAFIMVDLLRPIDPEARYGDAADDFKAAKRLLQGDIERLFHADDIETRLEALERVKSSLELVGDFGGYTSPMANKIEGKRSLDNYRALEDIIDALEHSLTTPVEEPVVIEPVAELEVVVPEEPVVEVVKQPVQEPVVEVIPVEKSWLEQNLLEYFQQYWNSSCYSTVK